MNHNHNGSNSMNTTNSSIGLRFSMKVEDLLFSNWSTESFLSYSLAILVVFLTSCILEFLNFLKQKTFQIYSNNLNDPYLRLKWKNIWKYKIYLMLLHIITLAFHYALMLIIMSFNLGLAFSILVGAGVGYIIFLENPLTLNNNSQYLAMKETKATSPIDHCSTSPSTIIINSFDSGVGDEEL